MRLEFVIRWHCGQLRNCNAGRGAAARSAVQCPPVDSEAAGEKDGLVEFFYFFENELPEAVELAQMRGDADANAGMPFFGFLHQSGNIV